MEKNTHFMLFLLSIFAIAAGFYLFAPVGINEFTSAQLAENQQEIKNQSSTIRPSAGKTPSSPGNPRGEGTPPPGNQILQRLEHLLQNAPAEETSNAVMEALSHPSPEVRMSGVDTAMALEPEAGVPILGIALKNDHAAVRELSLDYLEALDLEHKLTAIEIALKDAAAPAARDLVTSLDEVPGSAMFATLLESALAGKYSQANTRLVTEMLAGWLGENSLPSGETPSLEKIAHYWSRHRGEYSEDMLRFQ